MGNCIISPKKNNNISSDNNKVLKAIPYIEDKIPYDPSEDPQGNYIWAIIHFSKTKDLINLQKEGYIISMKEMKTSGYYFLRYKRN